MVLCGLRLSGVVWRPLRGDSIYGQYGVVTFIVFRYGGAKIGDRTMLDALSPAIDALEQSSTLAGLQSAVEVGGATVSKVQQ